MKSPQRKSRLMLRFQLACFGVGMALWGLACTIELLAGLLATPHLDPASEHVVRFVTHAWVLPVYITRIQYALWKVAAFTALAFLAVSVVLLLVESVICDRDKGSPPSDGELRTTKPR